MIGAPSRAISKVAHGVSGMNCRAAVKANKGSNPIDMRLLCPYAAAQIAHPLTYSVQSPSNRRQADGGAGGDSSTAICGQRQGRLRGRLRGGT